MTDSGSVYAFIKPTAAWADETETVNMTASDAYGRHILWEQSL